jgi:hypothetical protein
VASQQIELERAESIAWNPSFSQGTKSGIDAVNGFISRGFAIDDRSSGVDARRGLWCQRHRHGRVSDGEQVAERQ